MGRDYVPKGVKRTSKERIYSACVVCVRKVSSSLDSHRAVVLCSTHSFTVMWLPVSLLSLMPPGRDVKLSFTLMHHLGRFTPIIIDIDHTPIPDPKSESEVHGGYQATCTPGTLGICMTDTPEHVRYKSDISEHVHVEYPRYVRYTRTQAR